MLTKPKRGIKHFFLNKNPNMFFFSKFNFGENHVFDFYHTFNGKPEIKGKHQKNVQNVVNSMTIYYTACFFESVRGSFALATKVFNYLVSRNGIFFNSSHQEACWYCNFMVYGKFESRNATTNNIFFL